MKRFLIHISQGYSIPIGKPLQKEIGERGYEVKWFSESENAKKYLTKEEELLETVQDVIDNNPHIVLVAKNSVPHFFHEIKVEIFRNLIPSKIEFIAAWILKSRTA